MGFRDSWIRCNLSKPRLNFFREFDCSLIERQDDNSSMNLNGRCRVGVAVAFAFFSKKSKSRKK
jgi:hypothetical protein